VDVQQLQIYLLPY